MLDAVDVVDLDVLMTLEPKAGLVDASLDAPKGLLDTVAVVGLDVLAVFVMTPKPKAGLVDVSLDAPKGLLGRVIVVGFDVLAVSVMALEPKAGLIDVSLDAPKEMLAVGIRFVTSNVSWLVEAVTFVPNPSLGVEEDVPNPEKPVALCKGALSVDLAIVPKAEPVVVEDDGCTAALENPVAVVSGILVLQGERFVPKE